MDAEIVEHSAFQPDHECDGDISDGGECAEPSTRIADVPTHDVHYEGDGPRLAETSRQQVDQSPNKIEGWAVGREEDHGADCVRETRSSIGQTAVPVAGNQDPQQGSSSENSSASDAIDPEHAVGIDSEMRGKGRKQRLRGASASRRK